MKNITNRIQSNVWTLALLVVLCGCNKHKKDQKHTAEAQKHTADEVSSHTAKIELDEVANDPAPAMNKSTETAEKDQYDDGRPNYSSPNYDQTYI
jgi:hypothetical protein